MKKAKSLLLALFASSAIISSTTHCIDFKTFKEAPLHLKTAACASAYLTTATSAILALSVLPPHYRTTEKIATGIALTCTSPFASIQIAMEQITYGLKNRNVLKLALKEAAEELPPAIIGFGIIPYTLHKCLKNRSTDTFVAPVDDFLEAPEVKETQD